ncbi:MAG: ribonuclease PH [Clostridiales bacterium]|nr:ribonuclease PH [Clostridiales bacterium]MBP3940305.1 ribonuclease PH [Christensenellaceae bacterium]
MPRIDKRKSYHLREVRIIKDFMPNAAGSCLIEFGRTRVLCTATVQNSAPSYVPEGTGWLTAEYAMLPGSTTTRKQRERNKYDGRSIEIGRLIGRSLRSIMDFTAIPDLTITIDCDVIQADGGTRTASISGGFVALSLAVKKLLESGRIERSPIKCYLAAVSAGICGGTPLLDLCYVEDSSAEADMNYVGTEDGDISEIQVSGEKRSITGKEFTDLLLLCRQGVDRIIDIQKKVLEDE